MRDSVSALGAGRGQEAVRVGVGSVGPGWAATTPGSGEVSRAGGVPAVGSAVSGDAVTMKTRSDRWSDCCGRTSNCDLARTSTMESKLPSLCFRCSFSRDSSSNCFHCDDCSAASDADVVEKTTSMEPATKPSPAATQMLSNGDCQHHSQCQFYRHD